MHEEKIKFLEDEFFLLKTYKNEINDNTDKEKTNYMNLEIIEQYFLNRINFLKKYK